MRKIEEDLVALGKVTADIKKNRTTSLKKHLGELSGYRQARLKALKDTDAQIIAMEKEVVQLKRHLSEIIKDVPGAPTANAKQKTVNEYEALIRELKKQRDVVDREDKAAQEIVQEAHGYLADFEKIGQMDIPSTPIKDKAQKLKDCFSSLGSLLKNSQDLAKALK
jgi:seryl-tRNA synthetase